MATYDDFATRWHEQKREGLNLAHHYLEKPAMRAKVPSLVGKRVLALGCGSGEECVYLQERGAESLVGIDSSEEMLALARADFRGNEAVKFIQMKLEDLEFAPDSFDYVYSSLAMHYAQNWLDILQRIRSFTTLGSKILFSTHHPVTWGCQVIRTDVDDTRMMGYRRPKDTRQPAEVFGDYKTSRLIKDQWFGQLDVQFFHKPFSEIFREVREAGYRIIDLLEPSPTEEVRSVDPNFYKINSRLPPFVILELE